MLAAAQPGELDHIGPLPNLWAEIRWTSRCGGVQHLDDLLLRRVRVGMQAESEANWIRINQPEIWQKTHKFLFLSGYLTQKMVGNYVDSVACQVGYVPFDYKKLAWSSKSDWKWQAVPMAYYKSLGLSQEEIIALVKKNYED